MPTSNPWTGIGAATSGVSGRRVDAGHPWPFFWGLDAKGDYLLILETAHEPVIPAGLREFGGVVCTVYSNSTSPHFSLVLQLRDRRDWEMFMALSLDLVEITRNETTEPKALNALLIRLRRWQRLLQRSSRGPLSEPEIMGLIGELVCIRDELTPWYGLGPAIMAWKGPQASPQDFCVERTAVEVKARLGTDRDRIQISSLEQLVTALDRLVLFVITLVNARPEHDKGAVTLNSIVTELRTATGSLPLEIAETFDERLYKAGFVDGIDYSDYAYLIHERAYFEVREEFPRLQRGDVPAAVLSAEYTLNLAACASYKTNDPWGKADGAR